MTADRLQLAFTACRLLALLVTLAVAAVPARAAVRYLRADPELRASIRQAVRIRATWKRLARMQGLVVTDPTRTWRASLAASPDRPGEPPVPRTLVPAIRVRPDWHGVQITVRLLPRVGIPELTRAAPYLADAWRVARVSVAPAGPGRALIRAVRTDPLATTGQVAAATAQTLSGATAVDLTRWHVGVDEYAAPVAVRLAEVPGITVAGLPGYGKTSLINGLICQTCASPAIQYAVADGKAATSTEGDYADLMPRIWRFAGDDLQQAHDLFADLVALRRDRAAVIRAQLGVGNLWHVGPSAAWPLVVLVVDEAHTFFRDHKGTDPATKRLAVLAAENARLVEDLVKKGRAVGILTVLATQKATGDAIPTFIRDVCPVGLSFAQKTLEAAVAALGEDIRAWPDANPVHLQDPAFVGVASMAAPGRVGFTRVRTPYIPPEHAARVAAAHAHLTADPTRLLADTNPRLVQSAQQPVTA